MLTALDEPCPLPLRDQPRQSWGECQPPPRWVWPVWAGAHAWHYMSLIIWVCCDSLGSWMNAMTAKVCMVCTHAQELHGSCLTRALPSAQADGPTPPKPDGNNNHNNNDSRSNNSVKKTTSSMFDQSLNRPDDLKDPESKATSTTWTQRLRLK